MNTPRSRFSRRNGRTTQPRRKSPVLGVEHLEARDLWSAGLAADLFYGPVLPQDRVADESPARSRGVQVSRVSFGPELPPDWGAAASTPTAGDDDHDHDNPHTILYLPEQFDLTETPGQFLTGPTAGEPMQIALDFISSRVADMGLVPGDVAGMGVVTNYVTNSTGITHLGFQQQLNGLPVKNTNLSTNVTADGSVINAAGYFVSDIGRFADLSTKPALDAVQAVRAVATALGLPADGSVTVLEERGGLNQGQTLSAPKVSSADVPAALVFVATSGGVELAWEMEVQTPDGDHWYNLAVSATTGELLYNQDYVHHASYNVYAMPTEHPNAGGRSIQNDPWLFTPTPAVVPSPFGWHDTNGVAGAESTLTIGNNVTAYTDVDNNNAPDAGSQPDGTASLAFNFTIDLAQAPSTYRPASVTNLFYWNNVIHDVTYLYGFDEAARNFQTNNYGRGGSGNDAVQAEGQDGGGTNNANFATPADGSAPRMQMYLGDLVTPNRDGSLDNAVVVHEYGHGISNRLTNNGSGLGNTQSGGMGEGWSDWFGMMFTQTSATETTTAQGLGTYLFGQPANGAGIRDYMYEYNIASTSGTTNATFGRYGTGANQTTAVHNTGTRWASTLWDINHLLIQNYGYEPNLYNSTSTAGNIKAMHLIINGMKLQPSNPSFLQARDAILAADQALYGGANQLALWTAFARRGLGELAATSGSSSTSLTIDFTIPAAVQGLSVISTTPAAASTVSAPPANYVVNFSRDVDTATLQASDFTVNGSPATGVSYDAPNKRATFTFGTNPVTAQGLQTMAIAAGAIVSTAGTGSSPVLAFSNQFRFDVLALNVTSTTPANGGTFTLNGGNQTLDILFNENVASASVGTADLSLSAGTVTAAVRDASNFSLVHYTISGLAAEGTLNVTVPIGAVTDTFGNPNPAASVLSYQMDFGTVPFPTPLSAAGASGARTYQRTTTGVVNFNGDSDSLTLNLDPNQRVSIVVTPAAGLRPRVELFSPSSTSLGVASATTDGQVIALQAVSAAAGGTYRIDLSGLAGTTGTYSVQVILNSAVEGEGIGAGSNNTTGTAQDLDPAFRTESTTVSSGQVASVSGTTDGTSGYTAAAVTPVFEDISATGTVVAALTNQDDGVTSVPIGFSFPFYGTNYTDVGLNTNGLITFGTTTNSYANSDLTSSPTQAAIAVFWDDQHSGGGAAGSNVFTEVLGSGATQRLVVQWNQVRFYSGGTAGDTITYQAVLYADGRIQLNYQDLASGTAGGNNGAAASVGIKAAGTQGPDRLLLANNNGPNTYVGSNLSTLITPPAASLPDHYRITLAAGQTTTLGVAPTGTPGALSIELLDSGGAVVATGTAGSTNLSSVVSNFLSAAGGTFYARVTGASGVPYQLVVTKNAALDTEANDTAATAQPVSKGVGLGSVSGSAGYTAAAVTPVFEDISATGTVVAALTNQDDGVALVPIGFSFPFYGTNYTDVGMNSNGLITFGTTTGSYTNSDLTASPTQAAIAVFWDDQHTGGGAAGSNVFTEVLGSGATQRLVVQWNQVRFYSGGTAGDTITYQAVLYADGRVQLNYQDLASGTAGGNNGASASVGIKAAGTQGPDRLLLANNNGPNAYVGSNLSTLIAPIPGEDWYSVTLGAGETSLVAETSTPGDGAGEFVNTLNPKVQIYNDAGTTLIASGVVLGDGRNERATATGLTPGQTYKVRLLGEGTGTSAGEYLLSAAVPGGVAPTLSAVQMNGTAAPSAAVTLSRVTSLVLNFNTAVNIAPGAFSLTNGTSTITSAAGGAITVAGGGTNTITLTFTGSSGVDFGSLADGIWTLSTNMTLVTAVSGGTAGTGTTTTSNIRRLYGDIDNNGVVNSDDFDQFGNTFGLGIGEPGYLAGFDFDNNSVINSDDFDQFGNRFGISL